MDEISYIGKWTAFGRAVFVEHGNLSHPLIVGESEAACGLGWRRGGSDPEISRALLLHATGDAKIASRLGADFATGILADLPPAGFRLSRVRVLEWVAGMLASRRQTRSATNPHSEVGRRRGLRLIEGDGLDPGPPGPMRPGAPTRRRAAAGPTHTAA